MNENVTIKTPKRRRWIARLLVSALCILLASSLLFVGVFAETITLSAQYTGNYYVSVSSVDFISFIDADTFYYFGDDYLRYQDGDNVVGSRGSVWSDTNSSCYGDGNIFISSFAHLGSAMRWDLYTVGLSSFDSISSVRHDFASSTSSVTYLGSSSVYSSGTVYAFVFYKIGSDISVRVMSSTSGVLSTGYRLYLSSDFSFTPSMRTSSFVYGDFLVNLGANICFNLSTKQFVSLPDFGLPSSFSAFSYNGALYALTSDSILMCDDYTFSFRNVGSFGFAPLAVYVENGVITAASSFSAFNLNYTIFTGIDGSPPPPESSDETTTEPPPESSEESSEPDDSFTKIWKVDRGFSESYAGSIDLTNATKIRAFLGVFTSTGSMFFSDRAVPLTIEVYRDGSDSPDTYKFDFYAYGWSVSDSSVAPNSYDSYTFPDVVGRYYEIPIPSYGEDLYFPIFAPYGSIYILLSDSSYPYGIKRVTFNLHNPQGYLDVNFISSSSTSFTIYNDDLTKGITYTFDSGTYGYQSFYNDEGESYESIVYVPQVGSSVKFFADDVLETGMYSLHVYNSQSVFLPWSDDEYNNAISKFDQVSLDMELLESKANEAYGQFSFDSMVAEDFLGAVSDFNSIKDSSGGSFILDYIFGMWTIHPFASSMIAVVGTLAIIGFIIRKL